MAEVATVPLAPTTRITIGKSNASNAASSTVRFGVAAACGRWMMPEITRHLESVSRPDYWGTAMHADVGSPTRWSSVL